MDTGNATPCSPSAKAAQRAAWLEAYQQVRQYIDVEIVRLTPRGAPSAEKVKAARTFNRELGDPQSRFPSIQVAGTSGKGSTAQFLANILTAAGYRTGLHVSPYLQAMTEKTWISGMLVDPPHLLDACRQVRPVAERYRPLSDWPASVHGLASLALSYIEFARQEVEVAVIESSVGGRFDLVQGLSKELCIITDIGFDHTHLLGHSIDEIAWHKAGIMEQNVPCVALRSGGFPIIEQESRRVACPLIALDPPGLAEQREEGRMLLDLPRLGKLCVPTDGWPGYQKRNALVAAVAADELAARGWRIAPQEVETGLAGRWLPGRMERMPEPGLVILDGAHNAQKIGALWESLPPLPGPLILLLGLTGEREPSSILAEIRRPPDLVVSTRPVLYGKEVVDPARLEREARLRGLATVTEPDTKKALDLALHHLAGDGLLVVTGSIYLLGEVRSRWYPTSQILLQQTAYPRTAGRDQPTAAEPTETEAG
ncbi:MAG: hypothetical protein JW797_10340 [Bradymonadales bacterium]|nr:hypothetical protein [Bradymonadales bacterium]